MKQKLGTTSRRKAAGPSSLGNQSRLESRAAAVPCEAPAGDGFPVVGIGASAGGLAAFEAFFSAMPAEADPGMAFVLVQHLAPDHKSILTNLVQRYTRMNVLEVTDGITVKINHAYIIPPNRDMALLNGVLQLLEPSAPRGQRLPIDFFFRSLAQDQRERAIGIVLSGSGSDGTQGVRAIKGEGGMVMAQDPASIEHDSMPRSAIATGLVDFVLSPAKMPARLIAFTAQAFGNPPRLPATPAPLAESALKKIFVLVRAQTSHDFSQYKPSTINRRIERRLAVHQLGTMDEYVKYLQKTPLEVDALFRDLLIGVTGYYRDPEAFAALEELIIPKLFAGKSAGAPIRVWSPGCSSGEEAYSLAILLVEQMEKLKRSFKLQVFASDIDPQAISLARAGVYPAGIAADISPERLARFFTAAPEINAYRIHRSIRDILVFSEQNVIKDAPFSKLDLISCRNLLIYMNVDLQKKLIPLFHYSLNPGGFLFLGTSETVGEFSDLFAALDRKSKLYQRKEDYRGVQRAAPGRFLPLLTTAEVTDPQAPGKSSGLGKLRLRELTEQALLQQVSPAGALVNGRGDILYLHGRTSPYLELAPGEAGINNVLKMAREGLRRELSSALRKASAGKEIVHRPGLVVKTNGSYSTIDLAVRPVATDPAEGPGSFLYLVVFKDVPAPAPGRTPPDASSPDPHDPDGNPSITYLKRELRAKEESLQTANEELETSNEELKSSNEEMQSINEELQSTNEEVETSKEELQSVNEELATINSELQAKVADLSRANNDMNNLLSGTGIGTIFVDHRLRILRFTPGATRIINLIPTDVGRSLGHLVSNLADYEGIMADMQGVLDTLIPKELEVQSRLGEWYEMRIMPYRTVDNVIEGAVITFVDITELKKAMDALREAETLRRLAVVVSDAHDAITMQDLEGRILAWNPAAERLYGWSESEALAMNARDRIPEEERERELAAIQALSRACRLEPYSARRTGKNGLIISVWMTATALVNKEGHMYAVATTERAKEPPAENQAPGASRGDRGHDNEKV